MNQLYKTKHDIKHAGNRGRGKRERKKRKLRKIFCLSEKERRYSNGAPCLYILLDMG